MKNTALVVSGIIFGVVAAAHFYRFDKALVVTIGPMNFPVDYSLYAGIVSGILALWMFIAAAKSS